MLMAINSQNFVTAFNENGICGKNDWKLNEEKEVSPSMPNCEIIQSLHSLLIGYEFSLILKQEENKLKIYSEDKENAKVGYELTKI